MSKKRPAKVVLKSHIKNKTTKTHAFGTEREKFNWNPEKKILWSRYVSREDYYEFQFRIFENISANFRKQLLKIRLRRTYE